MYRIRIKWLLKELLGSDWLRRQGRYRGGGGSQLAQYIGHQLGIKSATSARNARLYGNQAQSVQKARNELKNASINVRKKKSALERSVVPGLGMGTHGALHAVNSAKERRKNAQNSYLATNQKAKSAKLSSSHAKIYNHNINYHNLVCLCNT